MTLSVAGNIKFRRKERNTAFSLAFLSFYLNSSARFFVPALIPLMIVLMKVPLTYIALIVTIYWVGYSLLQIPSGYITDKVGSARVNKISFLAFSLVFSLLYLFIYDYYAVLLISFSLGILSALVYISDISLVTRWSDETHRTLNIGIFQTAFFLGASLGEYITISLSAIGIRYPILFLAIFSLVLSIANIFLLKDPEGTAITPVRGSFLRISRGIMYIGLTRFSASFVYLGFLTMLTAFIVTFGSSSSASTSNLSWLGAIAGVLGAPFGGYLTEKLARGKIIPVIISNSLLAALIIFTGFIREIWLLIPVSLLMGFSYGMYAAPSMSLATELSGDDGKIGSASGFLNFSAQLGGIAAPVTISFLVVTTGGFSTAFMVVGLIAMAFLMPVLIGTLRGHLNGYLSRS